MKQVYSLLICLIWAVALQFSHPVATAIAQSDNVSQVAEDDRHMNLAMDSARKSLAEFWQAVETPPARSTGFALKVGFSENGNVEHIWCNKPERRNGKILATVANTPVSVTHIKEGQRVEIDPQIISDWMYIRADGKIVGGRTIRALLKHMSKEQADYYRSILVTE